MKTLIADGANYFGMTGFPILVGRSVSRRKPTDPPLHPHDLTEVQHRHDFHELVIVTKGRGLQCLEGMDLPITAGDVFLLQGRQRHFFHERQDLELTNVMYNPVQLALPENELRGMPGYCAMFILEPAYRQQHRFASRLHLERIQLAHVELITDEMERESQKKEVGYKLILLAKLLELITFLSRIYTECDSTETQALVRVGHVIGAIENGFSKDWTLDELVALSHMSKSNLLAVFRKATGQTPINYLMRLRIQRAMNLLHKSDHTITEIAFEVGFNDSNYFTRQFRTITGISPRQFRKQNHAS